MMYVNIVIVLISGSSANTLLDEFEIFMRSDKQLRRDGSLRNLSANLTLIRPYISKQPESLSYELLGRLVKYINQVTI